VAESPREAQPSPSAPVDPRRQEGASPTGSDGADVPDDGAATEPDLTVAARRAGLAPVRVTGCPPELLHAITAATAALPLEVGGRAAAAGVVGAAPFLRSVADLGEHASGPRIVASEGGQPRPGAAPGIERLERLWLALNRGQTLFLEPAPATAPDRPPPGPPDGGSPWTATVLDRLPLLREERGPEIRSVPTYLVLVDLEGVSPAAACETLCRLLGEVRDARFVAREPTPETAARLQATLGSDPRYLSPAAPIPAGVPYVVHTSVGVPLTTAVLDALAGWNDQQDVSVVRVVRPGDDDGQHLSLVRTAALLRDVAGDVGDLRNEPTLLRTLTDAEVAESAGLEWVLPGRVELARPAAPAADVLGATAAGAADLTAIGRLQQKIVRERRRGERLDAELEAQKKARKRAEAQLERRIVRFSLRIAERVGRVRAGLRS
jgi:hypothetical protein